MTEQDKTRGRMPRPRSIGKVLRRSRATLAMRSECPLSLPMHSEYEGGESANFSSLTFIN
jgi:hypothetical protein